MTTDTRGHGPRLMIFEPPRHGKSELSSKYLPCWFIGQWPDRKATVASYAQALALSWGRVARNLMAEFGPTVWGVNVDRTRGAAADWGIAGREGGFKAVGVGSGLTGTGADILIIDDPFKDSMEAQSEVTRQAVWDWYQSTASTRLMPGGGCCIVMTRWHDDDLAGRLLKQDPRRDKYGRKLPDDAPDREDADGDRWDVICLPGIAEDWTTHPMMDGPDLLDREVGEVLWPEQFGPAFMEQTRRARGRYWFGCTPAETPILMGDWRTKPISEVRVGDEVVGFQRGDRHARAKLIRSTVTATQSRMAMVHRLEMASGRPVRCTADHRWYTGRGDEAGGQRRKTYDVPKVGRRLCFVCPPEDIVADAEELMRWWYLAGIVDGEGYIGVSALRISQSPDANPEVFKRIGELLDQLGLSHQRLILDRDRPRWGRGGEFLVHNAMDTYRKLLRHTEPAKAPQMIDRLFERGHMFIRERDQVQAIVPEQVEPVYSLETTSGNYVAWGYASSNSMFQQRPTPDEGGMFQRSKFRYWTWVDRENQILEYWRGEDGTEPALIDLRHCGLFGTCDVAATEKTYSDYTVLAIWAVTHTRDLLLLDFHREQIDTTKQQGWVLQHWAQWPACPWIGVENATHGLGLIQGLRKLGHAIKKLKPDRDKVARASVAGTLMENGQTYFPAGHPLLEDWERELLTFPNATHDDMVDTFGYAAIQLPKIDVGVPSSGGTPVTFGVGG